MGKPIMRFEYEITEEDFVAAQHLYFKSLHGRSDIGPLAWIAGGLLLCAVAWNEGALNYASFLLGGVGFGGFTGGPQISFRRGGTAVHIAPVTLPASDSLLMWVTKGLR
jgi:hypothetical protein